MTHSHFDLSEVKTHRDRRASDYRHIRRVVHFGCWREGLAVGGGECQGLRMVDTGEK